jgi:hypothetical protein
LASCFTPHSSIIAGMPPPGLEPGTQRSKRRMIIHFNTEASHVSRFHVSRFDYPSPAGFEPATRS